jgi:hypothetical protein
VRIYLTADRRTTIDSEVAVDIARLVASGEWTMVRGRAEIARRATTRAAGPRRSSADRIIDAEIDATLADLGL